MPLNSTEGRLSTRSKQRLTVLVTIIALVLMLVAAELGVRIRQQLKYGTAATVEDYYTVDPKTGLRIPIANLSSGHISINSLGFRGPEFPIAKPSGTVRLAFLGASTTWCGEVSGNHYVWPHLVASSLSDAFPKVRFDYVNAAVPGYTMSSMLKSMERRVAALEPDVVIIYEASNNLSGELREVAAKQGIIETAQWEPFSWPSRYSLLWLLAEKNLRVLSAQRSARTNPKRVSVDTTTLGKEYREELTQVVRAAQQSAKIVALATFSIHPRIEQAEDEQISATSSAFVYMPFVTPRLLIESFERYNEIVREVARETGVLLIEGENDIPGNRLHFADTVHFTDAGSKAMAERVTRALMVSGQLKDFVFKNVAAH